MGYWDIGLSRTSAADKAVYIPITGCNYPNKNQNACLLPPLSNEVNDKLKISITAGAAMSPKISEDEAGMPHHVDIRVCYAKPSTIDKPWRKPGGAIKVRAAPWLKWHRCRGRGPGRG